MRWVEHVARMG